MICRAPIQRRGRDRDMARDNALQSLHQPEWEGWTPVDNRMRLTPRKDTGGSHWVATLMMEKEIT